MNRLRNQSVKVDHDWMTSPDRSSFTLNHPLVSIFLLGFAMAAFDFAVCFPPLIFWLGNRADWICFTLLPMVWGISSAVLLVRSFYHKLWPARFWR